MAKPKGALASYTGIPKAITSALGKVSKSSAGSARASASRGGSKGSGKMPKTNNPIPKQIPLNQGMMKGGK